MFGMIIICCMSKSILSAAGVATVLVALVACGSDSPSAESTVPAPAESTAAPPASDAGPDTTDPATTEPVETTPPQAVFPRTIEHALGTTEIPAQPERIVSAGVSITGPLLAIDAPVIASGLAGAGNLADEHSFFIQWGDVAVERGVEGLPGPEVSVEAIAAQRPDLIVGTATGADAVTAVYDQLSQIAPTVVFDTSTTSWEDLTRGVAEAAGLEDAAARVIAEFETLVADTVATITPPDAPAIALADNPEGAAVFTIESAQGRLLADLGFDVVDPSEFRTGADGGRGDIVRVPMERIPDVVGDASVFYVNADQAAVDTAATRTVLAASPALLEDRMYALGFSSFRIDPYSATQFVERIAELFG